MKVKTINQEGQHSLKLQEIIRIIDKFIVTAHNILQNIISEQTFDNNVCRDAAHVTETLPNSIRST